MKISGLRSPHAQVGGLVYFGRMLDKIRLHAAGKLPPGFNLGEENWYFFDARCCRFLGVKYAAVAKRVGRGGTDLQVERLWQNMIKWLTSDRVCQVPIMLL